LFTDDLRNNKEKVKHILETYPAARDSDKVLFLKFHEFFNALDAVINHQGYEEFVKLFMGENFPSLDALSRIRRKLQEGHEEIRGQLYYQRRSEQFEVRKWLEEDS